MPECNDRMPECNGNLEFRNVEWIMSHIWLHTNEPDVDICNIQASITTDSEDKLTTDGQYINIDDHFINKDEWDINSQEIYAMGIHTNTLSNTIPEDYHVALLASLYSQVEFLRAELTEKNFIIHNLMKEINYNQ